MGPESPGSQTFVEGHNVFGSSSCLASSVNIDLTARAFTGLAESENIRTTEGTFCTEQLKMQSPSGLESSDNNPGVLSFRTFIMKSSIALEGMPTPNIINRRLRPNGSTAHMTHDLRHCGHNMLRMIRVPILPPATVCSHRAEPLQSKQHSRPDSPTNLRSHVHVSRYLTLLQYILAASCPTLGSDSVFLSLPHPP